jgi:membrane protein required for colicin V production
VIDLLLGVVIGVSAFLGLIRGFVGIVVGTASWLLAGWASFQFGNAAAGWLAEGRAPTMTQSLGGYALVFVTVLVAVGLVGYVIRATVQATRLGATDRVLGFGLGLVRGGFFAAVLVVLMSFTPLTREPAWQASRILPVIEPGAGWMRAQLPSWQVPNMNLDQIRNVDLGKLPLAGDNVPLDDTLKASGLEGDGLKRLMSQTLEQVRGSGAVPIQGAQTDPALPTPIADPAQVRPGHPDPARVEGNGQARPPSQ